MNKNTRDKNFNFHNFWGDKSLLPYINFSRNGKHYCIYCGKESDTREHVPPKAFLKAPYPNDLVDLPACFDCNNKFSKGEKYTKDYIDCMNEISLNESLINIKVDNKVRGKVLETYKKYRQNRFCNQDMVIEQILVKIAYGHLVYKFCEKIFYDDHYSIKVLNVVYNFKFQLSIEQLNKFNEIVWMSDKKVPSLGARFFDDLYVIEQAESEGTTNNLVFLDWTTVQENFYRYICWEENEEYHIKIVIKEFLFGEVIFKAN